MKIHWPANFAAVPDKASETGIMLEPQKGGVMLLDRELSLTETWKALIAAQKAGKIKRWVAGSNMLGA